VVAAVASLPAGARAGAPWAHLRDSGGGGGAQSEKVQQQDESGKRPAGPAPAVRRPAPPSDPAREADRLLQENVQLHDRIRALEQQTEQLRQSDERAQQLEAQLAQLRAAQDAARDQAEAHHRALAAALGEFFATAAMIDQSLTLAQSESRALRQVGVRMNPVPDVGYVLRQLRLAATTRVMLRGLTALEGVDLREVDQPLAAREVAGAVTLQSAVYLNAYAMGRLRELSDSPGFPPALRDLLHSAPFIYEVSPPPIQPGNASPPAASPGSIGAMPAPSVVSPAAPQVTAPAVLPEVAGPNLTGSGQGAAVLSAGPARSNLVTGSAAVPFTAVDVTGRSIRFPDDYKGKIVLLDFWATWCQPCLRELPAVMATYGKYHTRGLEILGISLDQPDQIATLRQFVGQNQMDWPQIYDGKGWRSDAAVLYGVRVMPARYLVDGNTGKILAGGSVLSAGLLDSTLSRFFAERT
jgi:peroxiredoxin